MASSFRKILIANRGEIAVRIAQTVQQMGIAAVAVFSDPDRAAPHVAAANEAYPLPGETAADTYLRGDRIIEIAKAHGVDAIHPGYGFLSENAAFSKAVTAAGLTFIGPTPEVISAMGDKITAKATFEKAGVPVIPGWTSQGTLNPAEALKQAEKIGYPVLIKAAAGGGGKGMRVVHKPADFNDALQAAARESKAAFGDDRVFLEKFLVKPRHIEIQVFGDSHGNYVHLFERECSVQRRHQKIIEESPSPAVDDKLRQRMGEAAVTAARAIDYRGAGTVEFVVDQEGGFYFLEVNTRLQVEHPVTELVTGHDLVRAQVLVAQGEPLPFSQENLSQTGHALECRIYAEDPSKGFLPSVGRIDRLIAPAGPGIRFDAGVREGATVSTFYDPMLAKMIVWGRTRDESIARMVWALRRLVVLGVTTNVEYLVALCEHPTFVAGDFHTQLLDNEGIELPPPRTGERDRLLAAAVAADSLAHKLADSAMPAAESRVDPWSAAGGWRNG